jgi:hypothetical protein
MSDNFNFTSSLNIGMNHSKNQGHDVKNKEETNRLRTLILSTNVNDYDTGE